MFGQYDLVADWLTFRNINFNVNDGVNTQLTINFGLQETPTAPDYLLVCQNFTAEGDIPAALPVLSRWFVLESHWNRERQLILTLRRDLIADFWDAFKNNDFYAEKGPIPTGYDVLAYNSEGMTFNSILHKSNRTLLRPESLSQNKRYIIGYIDRGWAGGTITDEGGITATYRDWSFTPFKDAANCTIDGVSTGGTKVIAGDIDRLIRIGAVNSATALSQGQTAPSAPLRCYTNRVHGEHGTTGSQTYSGVGSGYLTTDGIISSVAGQVSSRLQGFDNSVKARFPNIEEVTAEMLSLNNKSIRVGDKVYSVSLHMGSSAETYSSLDETTARASIISFLSYLSSIGQSGWENLDGVQFVEACCIFSPYTITLTTESVTEITDTRNHIKSLPYDIFVCEDNVTTREFAADFAAGYIGGNVVYDIQVLPFKPPYDNTGRVQIKNTSEYIYWATDDSINGKFYHGKIKSYSGNTEKKIGSNQHLCRLYSPNGADCWEFNPAKIGGVAANSIQYEVTFAPLRPYIHIFPTFGGIYGSENKYNGDSDAYLRGESRGLICSGDYSIPYSTNNWFEYQLRNSAYQLSHDRTIQNMSVQHSAERLQENVNIMSGAVGGVLSGAQTGMMAGGPYAAVAGAAVGGIANLVAGSASQKINERLRAEELSYAEDMFGYSLQNIRAQAQPLSHSNYLTVGVAYFPYIELYEADSKEEDIFTDRLRVNGWSLGIVTTAAAMKTAATAASAPTQFMKGRLVYFDGNEDAHVANEINMELQRGVRFLAES